MTLLSFRTNLGCFFKKRSSWTFLANFLTWACNWHLQISIYAILVYGLFSKIFHSRHFFIFYSQILGTLANKRWPKANNFTFPSKQLSWKTTFIPHSWYDLNHLLSFVMQVQFGQTSLSHRINLKPKLVSNF